MEVFVIIVAAIISTIIFYFVLKSAIKNGIVSAHKETSKKPQSLSGVLTEYAKLRDDGMISAE